MDKYKIIKMLVLLAAIAIFAGGLLRMLQRSSMSLSEYEYLSGNTGEENVSVTDEEESDPISSEGVSGQQEPSPTENLQNPETGAPQVSQLTGASLNGSSQTGDRVTYTEGFYYEPISDNLRRYMTGISYPGAQTPGDAVAFGDTTDTPDSEGGLAATWEELRYVHIWHYDFDGNPAEGELVCNEYIAQDLVEIFYELYRNEYQLERVLLIDEYDGDEAASTEDNNTFCFNCRTGTDNDSLSKHALGLAVDVNPLYNPHITYNKDGSFLVSPASAEDYADRTLSFPYKIDEEDLCYKLFIRHGFTWGGNRNDSKDYQHFQKALP